MPGRVTPGLSGPGLSGPGLSGPRLSGPGLEEAAPAKVNLFLRVVGRRADGYHLLDSLAVFPDIGDRLCAWPDPIFSLAVEGPFAAGLTGAGDNLVTRAAVALAGRAGVAVSGRVVLEKRLPVASGIGGGSADAAAAMRLLARLWRIGMSAADRAAVAASLGADVPVCLASLAARMGGIGEILGPAPDLPACGMVLVNPGVAVATPAVFAARTGGFSAAVELPRGWTDAAAMARDLAGIGNDLEPAAIACAPVIASVLTALRALPGCLLARMSGSGATCFALFPSVTQAAQAALAVRRDGWWSWGGGLG